MTKISNLAPPAGTKTNGRRLWDDVLEAWELDEHELALLREAVRTVDLLDDLAALVTADGPVISTKAGPKVHPAAVEARQQKIALARLLAVLRLPEDATGRPQRRVGARGTYGIRGVV